MGAGIALGCVLWVLIAFLLWVAWAAWMTSSLGPGG